MVWSWQLGRDSHCPISTFHLEISLRNKIAFARARDHTGSFHDRPDLVETGLLSLRGRGVGEAVLASQVLKSFLQNQSEVRLRFKLEGASTCRIGDFGEEFTIRAGTSPPYSKWTRATTSLDIEARRVNLRPALLRFLDDLLRVLDRPLLCEVATD
jgi:hypothetical protein